MLTGILGWFGFAGDLLVLLSGISGMIKDRRILRMQVILLSFACACLSFLLLRWGLR